MIKHMLRPSGLLASAAAIMLAVTPLRAQTVYDFESLVSGVALTNQIGGVEFSGAFAYGFPDLNEISFPPRSGSTVVGNERAAITITFDDALASFAAFFTYTSRLSLTAYDVNGQALGTAASLFDENEGGLFNPTNERIALMFAGIRRVTIAPSQPNTFVMDDMTLTPQTTVPEPSSVALVGFGAVSLLAMARRLRS